MQTRHERDDCTWLMEAFGLGEEMKAADGDEGVSHYKSADRLVFSPCCLPLNFKREGWEWSS